MTRRSFGLGMIAAASSPIANSAFAAEGSALAEAVLRVGLAEEQAVITQRIPMCAGFIKLSVEPSRFLANMSEAADRFKVVLAGLRDGSADLGLKAETNGEILEAMSALDAVWPTMDAAVQQILASGVVDDASYSAIARSNSALLFMTENIEKRLLQTYGDSGHDLSILIAVEIAARQEMLTQKMAKEVTKIALGFKPEENRKILAETVRLYENSLQALLGGVEALKLPEPPEHIRLALLEEKSRWSDLGLILKEIANGAEVGILELYSIASQEESLLEAAKHIEHMYVEMGAQG